MPSIWQTVRVFISSTFRDMHAERDWLVRRVFPALRERLDKHRIHLVDIDLRWGVTKEQADNDQALDVCLDQIDTCRPFFLGILGERYGWVSQRVPERVISKWGWIRHHTRKSITELEILHGVLLNPAMHAHAFFFFRDASFLADVPPAKQVEMSAEDRESAAKQSRLKEAIRGVGLPIPPFENYPCRYAGLRIDWRVARLALNETDQRDLDGVAGDGLVDLAEYAALDERLREIVHRFGVVHLAGLEEFGNRVSELLWQAIRTEHNLPDEPVATASDPLAEEADYHERFLESRLRVYVGRQSLQDELTRYATGGDMFPCMVTGPSGSGKSAALARFVQAIRQSGNAAGQAPVLVIPHFIGASPTSTGLRPLLHRFCSELKAQFGFTETVPPDTHALIGTFRRFVGQVPQHRRVVLVLDALNQLDAKDHAHDLEWFPWELPPHVKLIASSISDSDPTELVQKAMESRSSRRIEVGLLTDAERRGIIREIPSLSAKTLDDAQVNFLLSNPATTNPLFLLVALEELRGFGSFEQLNQRISLLPQGGDAVTAVFGQVIERLEGEFDGPLVRSVLTLLASARDGLSERELQDLVAGSAGADDFFPLLRQLRPYLLSRGGLLGSYHNSFFRAVRERYLASPVSRRAAHAHLASYFSNATAHTKSALPIDSAWRSRQLSELPYQQTRGELWDDLLRTLSDGDFRHGIEAASLGRSLQEDFAEAISHAVRCDRLFVASRLAELRSGLQLDPSLARNPAQVGLITCCLVRAGDGPALSRLATAVLQAEDVGTRIGGCLELFLAAGGILPVRARDALASAVREGIVQLQHTPSRGPGWALVPDLHVVHGRAYMLLNLLEYMRNRPALSQALRLYKDLPGAWTLGDYALRPQVETATVRRDQIELLLRAADEDAPVCQSMSGLLGEDALCLIDVQRFETVGDLVHRLRPQISVDRFARVLHKLGRHDLLAAWQASSVAENNESERPSLDPMHIALAAGDVDGARTAMHSALQKRPDHQDPQAPYFIFLLDLLREWNRYGLARVIREELRSLWKHLPRFKLPSRLDLAVDGIYLASRNGVSVSAVHELWRRMIGAWWPDCRENPDWSGPEGIRRCRLLKDALEKPEALPQELAAIQEWVWSRWEEERREANLPAWEQFARYAAASPVSCELLQAVIERFSQHMAVLLEARAGDRALEEAIYYGEAIVLHSPLREHTATILACRRMLVGLAQLQDERRYASRLRSLLANLLRLDSHEMLEQCRPLFEQDHRSSRLLEVLTKCLRVLVAGSWNGNANQAPAALRAALQAARELRDADFEHFGSMILSSRWQHYNADHINRESVYEMGRVHGAPGAHTDAFDNSPNTEGRWLVELLLAEAQAYQGHVREARQRLQVLILKLEGQASLPETDGMPRYTEQQAARRARWMLARCHPLARKLDLVPAEGTVTPSVSRRLASSSTFEEAYRFLGDTESWVPVLNRALLTDILARASTEPRQRCHFLLLLVLRGLAQATEERQNVDDPTERAALDELLAALSTPEFGTPGESLNSEAHMRAETISSSDLEPRNFCQQCGTPIPAGPSTAPCPHCGADLPYDDSSTRTGCTSCSHLIAWGSRYCTHCGALQ